MQRLIDQGDFVTDTQTGLDWQKTTACLPWFNTITAKLAEGWRMPTRYELHALHEAAAAQPGLIPTRRVFWSSSECGSSRAWLVDFNDGSVYDLGHEHSYAVRLVRASAKDPQLPLF